MSDAATAVKLREISEPEWPTMPGKHGGRLRRGNPDAARGGRPKTKHLKRELSKLAHQPVPAQVLAVLSKQGFKGRTQAEAWAFAESRASMLGEVAALKELADRLDGKVKEELELSGGLDFGVLVAQAFERARSSR